MYNLVVNNNTIVDLFETVDNAEVMTNDLLYQFATKEETDQFIAQQGLVQSDTEEDLKKSYGL